MKLSQHFTLEELSTTQVRGVDNTPPPSVMDALHATASAMEVIRSILKHPIIVTSGFRCEAVNKAVGGSATSAHMTGHAVDFICPGFGPPLKIAHAIVQAGIKFDQLIEEGTWVHISFDPRLRRQIKTMGSDGQLVAGLREIKQTA